MNRDETLSLDRRVVSATIESAHRALNFLLGAVEQSGASSPEAGRRAAIELHRFADGIAILADDAAAAAVVDAEVIDLAAARLVREARQEAETLL